MKLKKLAAFLLSLTLAAGLLAVPASAESSVTAANGNTLTFSDATIVEDQKLELYQYMEGHGDARIFERGTIITVAPGSTITIKDADGAEAVQYCTNYILQDGKWHYGWDSPKITSGTVEQALSDRNGETIMLSFRLDNNKTAFIILGDGSANTPSGFFTDVAATSPFYDAVRWAVREEITTGKTDTTFAPNEKCTTGQILTFLWRAMGQPAPGGANPFGDVSADAYYYKAALWAHEQGLISGGTFGADVPCTRSQTVTYLWKLAGSPAADAPAFTDVAADADYAQAVSWAVEQRITTGTSKTTFSPDDTCTRGQIVTFLYRDLA